MAAEEIGRHGRRRALMLCGAAVLAPRAFAQDSGSAPAPSSPAASRPPPAMPHAQVRPGRTLRFPEDHGAHPEFRTEWWYVTGWLESAGRAPHGFQVTFFRARPEIDARNPSAFAARQIIIAHAALSDTAHGRLLHDQTLARAALGLAGAEEKHTRVWIDDWALSGNGRRYRARVPARDFALDLELTATQPPLLQGEAGYSRKGPRPESASYYYSLPQLDVSGTLIERSRSTAVGGRAWLDHEWSSTYLEEGATGWDWIGINFDDGAALMAFRIRDMKNAALWAGATYRDADGTRRVYAHRDVQFTPVRTWRSPRTGATYPVAWRVRAGAIDLTIEPLMEDQENDTRASVGTIYWEGAVRALRDAKPAGRGYLELTGYWRPIKV